MSDFFEQNRNKLNVSLSSEEVVLSKSANAGLPDESVDSYGGVVHDKLNNFCKLNHSLSNYNKIDTYTGLVEPHLDTEVPLWDFGVGKATDSESMHGTFVIDHLDVGISGS